MVARNHYELAREFVTEFFPGAARHGKRRADSVVTNFDQFPVSLRESS